MTDPDYAPESATLVSTSGTDPHARDRVVTLRGPPSDISSLVLFLVFISGYPTNELRIATKSSSKLITIQLRCPRMH